MHNVANEINSKLNPFTENKPMPENTIAGTDTPNTCYETSPQATAVLESPGQLNIEATRNGRKHRVITRLDSTLVHWDLVTLDSDQSRDEYAQDVAAITGLDARDIRSQLLRLAEQEAESETGNGLACDAAQMGGLDSKAEKALAETTPVVLQYAEVMMSSPNLLEDVVRDVQQTGVAGEDDLISSLYLVATSRLLASPLSAIVQGSSSSGKSHVVEHVRRMIPDEAHVIATDMTANSLFYMEPGSLVHRLVVGGERRRGKDQDTGETTRALREMMSAGQLTKVVTVYEGGMHVARTIHQRGPIAFVETTTLNEIFDEDANRCIPLASDESPDQTRRVLEWQAGLALSSPVDIAAILAKHHALQRMLKRVRVEVSFARTLATHFPANGPHARRAFAQLLGLIESSALLHQRQRADASLNHGDTIRATVADYAIARRLLRGPFATSLGLGLPDAVLKFAAWLAQNFVMQDFASSDVRGHPDAPMTSRDKINRNCKQLEEVGFLTTVQAGRGSSPRIWRIVGELPRFNDDWLPEPDTISME
jgi:hypothetical protein